MTRRLKLPILDKKRQIAAVASRFENGPIVVSSSPKCCQGDADDLGDEDASGDPEEPFLTILNPSKSAVNPPSPCVVVRFRVGFPGV